MKATAGQGSQRVTQGYGQAFEGPTDAQTPSRSAQRPSSKTGQPAIEINQTHSGPSMHC